MNSLIMLTTYLENNKKTLKFELLGLREKFAGNIGGKTMRF